MTEKNQKFELLKEQIQEEEIKYWQAQRNGCDESELKAVVEKIKKLKTELLELRK